MKHNFIDYHYRQNGDLAMLRFLLPSPRIFQMREITGLNIVKRLFIWFQFPAFFNSVISGCESYHSSSLIVSRQLSQLWRLSCRISSELLVLSVCVCGAFLVCFFIVSTVEMAGTLSWESFARGGRHILRVSNAIGDRWQFRGTWVSHQSGTLATPIRLLTQLIKPLGMNEIISTFSPVSSSTPSPFPSHHQNKFDWKNQVNFQAWRTVS